MGSVRILQDKVLGDLTKEQTRAFVRRGSNGDKRLEDLSTRKMKTQLGQIMRIFHERSTRDVERRSQGIESEIPHKALRDPVGNLAARPKLSVSLGLVWSKLWVNLRR
jgi:hypothetical protein